MNKDLLAARTLLEAKGYTCVLQKDAVVYTSYQRGVKPLLELLDAGVDLRGFSVADKVVGKAAALLYCLMGVREVYAPIISDAAVRTFHFHGIACSYDQKVDAIQNRRKNGLCPMEIATMDVDDPVTALNIIRNKLKEING